MTQLATDVTSAKNLIGPPPSQKETFALRLWRTFFGSALNSVITLAMPRMAIRPNGDTQRLRRIRHVSPLALIRL